MNSQSPSLAAANVSVTRNARELIHGIWVNLLPGELHVLIGPNGSGKSTLLRALAGLWPVSQGEVLVNGAAFASLARRELARAVSYVPQDTRIDFAFTVAEIVAMGRFAHRSRFQAESPADHQAVLDALAQCDVGSLAGRAVNTLSGGERQRVVIARSLAAAAQFLLLDEPTANLDPRHAIEVFELCRRLTQTGHGILLATHDLSLGARYAHRLSVLHNGTLAASGPTDTTLTPELAQQVFGIRLERLEDANHNAVYTAHPL